VLLTSLLSVSCGGAFGQGHLSQGNEAPSEAASPGPIAVGARFRPKIEATVAGSEGPTVRLLSARPDVVEVDKGELLGVAPGMSAVLFVDRVECSHCPLAARR
jgi:hypothetical protein